MGLSRYDFLRIVLPGAIILFLTDALLRVLVVERDGSNDRLVELMTSLEDPLIGLAVAFGIGLCLYFVDPAVHSAIYFRNIPSTHLRTKLHKAGIQTNALSLFFVASDALMPAEMRERALLFGAFFRVGFQATLLTIATGAILPALLLVRSLDQFAPARVDWERPEILVVVSVVSALALGAGMGLLRDVRKKKKVAMPIIAVLLPFLVSSFLWVNLVTGVLPRSARAAHWQLAATLCMLLPWLLLRTLGPLRPRFTRWGSYYLRGEKSQGRSDKPYPDGVNPVLDVLVAINAGIGLVVLSNALNAGQILGTGTLILIGLMLSLTRKHEKQLQGIYSNQNYWIDSQFEAILELVPK